MNALTPSLGPALDNEPIPGYVLRSRLGSGGYGEVWEAEAPGGLRKAVKFVYGTLDEARAQRELKSLNRIKEVRHPFLLSIERIEIIDGRLLIVTELAQGCVKDRFDACRAAGMPGIPRDELLGFLHDAADALDFIHEQHGLQHLDIKPENLLLVGGHVKVADFGLLKDLSDSASLMGGVTPLYCPPEAFDGRPSRHCDQYSLAIVYQEMLTGEAPFGGRTAAQLAAQHLHSPPILTALPPADQPVIARALSKRPEQRFASCHELFENLAESRPATAGRSQRTPRTAKNASSLLADGRVARTEPLGPRNAESTSVSAALPAAEIRDLPRIDLGATEFCYRPTVFIGVGGAAGRVLSSLRRRLHARFGDAAAIPALQMLLIDTDSKALSDAMFRRGDGSVPGRNTLAIPLRSAKDYRSVSRNLLEWLSRRWLYNIPRSRQTEGLRPLGRLAFVDHVQNVFTHVRKAIEAATDASAVDESRRTTGLDFQAGPPRVFIIASIAGGTGSGVVLDLGYAVRKVLGELNFPDEGVCAILTHSTNRNAAARDLAVANTLACLQELRHFSGDRCSYPGDPACDLAPVYENNAAFHDTYVVHLGDELASRDFDSAADRLGEFLFQNAASPAAAFFERARREGRDAAQGNSLKADRVRTLGLGVFESVAGPPAPESDSRLTATFEHEPAASADTDANVGETQQILAPDSLEDACRRAIPELIDCGGARRTLVLTPPGFEPQSLLEIDPGVPERSLTCLEHASRETVICQDVGDVPLANLVARLVGSRHDYVELADRLHSRIDVEWSPLRD